MATASSKVETRFASIDLLRGIACLAVVFFHYLSRGPAGGWMQGLDAPLNLERIARYGYLGVHLFFIISGFVILWSVREASPRAFVAARAARLYPAFWVAVPLTATAVWFSDDIQLMVPVSHAIVNLTMFPHWFRMSYVDGAYWSLAVELHFYIYVWMVLRLGVMRWLEVLLAAWLAVSFIDYLRPMYPVELWLNAKWAPFFVAGCVLYRMRAEGVNQRRIALLIASWLLAVAWSLADSAKGIGPNLPLNPVVVAGLVTAIFATVTLLTIGGVRIEVSRFTAIAGALTYPLYLVHQNIGYVLHAKLFALSGNARLALAIVFVIVLLLSWIIHHGVERFLGPWLRRKIMSA